MNFHDPVFDRLATLAPSEVDPKLAAAVRSAAVARLRARPLHPVWTFVIAASVLSYLGWAVRFSANLSDAARAPRSPSHRIAPAHTE